MEEAVVVDPISLEETRVVIGHGTVASVCGVGAPIGDSWPIFLVEIHNASDDGIPRPLGSVLTATVAATNPLCALAIDMVARGREGAYRIEHRRLPHIPLDRPLADLVDDADTMAVLVMLEESPPLSLALHLPDMTRGEDL